MARSWGQVHLLPDRRQSATGIATAVASSPFVVVAQRRPKITEDLRRTNALKVRASLITVLGRKTMMELERHKRLCIVERQEALPAAAHRLADGAPILGYNDGVCAWLVAASVVPRQASGVLLHDLQLLRQVRSGWQRALLRLHVLHQRFAGWCPGTTLTVFGERGPAGILLLPD